MLRNNKGFSLVELLAIIFISSVIIWPLTVTLVNNIEINDRLHYRRSATSIADGTMYGLDKLDFTDLDAKVDAANTGGTYFIELNSTTCSTLDTEADRTLCTTIFNLIWSNLILTDGEYRVFIYDYNLSSETIAILYGNEADIPIEVRNEINAIPPSTEANPSLLRVTVWIEYYQDPVSVVILSGVLFDE